MNKKEFITEIAKKTEVSQETVKKLVNAFTETVTEALKAGEDVQLTGFGTFKISERAARAGVNPFTKEKIEIKASKAPVFKAGKAFKEALN